MANVSAWVQAARPLAAGNVLVPVIWGAIFAAGGSSLELRGLAFALLWAWLDQLFIVFANDVADERVDRLGDASPMSGGSRVLVQGKLGRQALAKAAGLAATALLGLSLALAWTRGVWALPAAALAALALLWAYSFAPLRRSYRAGGMGLQALGVGALLPLVGWMLQGRASLEFPPLAFVPAMILAAASHLLTALPDIDGDRLGDKQTRPVRKGEARVRTEAFALMLMASALAVPCLQVAWTWALGSSAVVALGYLFARNFVRDRVGRIRFSMVGLAVNVGVWALWIAWASRSLA